MKRSLALDALRGYAIMTMILSATEAFQILPRWMYHAQVPPPDHVFDPTIFGITWVDLIFPFFLFSMGAAFPLSLKRQYLNGVTRMQLVYKSFLRFLRLAFFAVFCVHMFPYMMGYSLSWLNLIVPILAFGWMCVMFMPYKGVMAKVKGLRIIVYVVAIAWLFLQPYSDGKPFSPNTNDIIIMILANVSLVGSIIYIYTMDRPIVRLALIPFIMALFLSSSNAGSWQHIIHDFTPLPWLYHFSWMEYLLIIIPGTIAGEILMRHSSESTELNAGGATVAFLITIVNVVCLYNRWLIANLLLSALLIGILWRIQRNAGCLDKELGRMGFYFLILGLFIEAFEGGIRKDDVTMSYMFVMSGLAFFALIALTVVCDRLKFAPISKPLAMVGHNPMVAYVICSMVVIPVLSIIRVYPLLEQMVVNPWLGFLKGVILTALSMALTTVFTYKKWYWKT